MRWHSSPWRRLERLEARQCWAQRSGSHAAAAPLVWTPSQERAEEVVGILDEAGVFRLAPPEGWAPELTAAWTGVTEWDHSRPEQEPG